jgi:hypothetical protein
MALDNVFGKLQAHNHLYLIQASPLSVRQHYGRCLFLF